MIFPVHLIWSDFFDALDPNGAPPIRISWRDRGWDMRGARADRTVRLDGSCRLHLSRADAVERAPDRIDMNVIPVKVAAQQVREFLSA